MDSAHDLAVTSLKIECLANGLRVSPEVLDRLSHHGAVPLTVHEYATTGGLTLDLGDGVFLNAPFDEWYCGQSRAAFVYDAARESFGIDFGGEVFPARVLPLPGYLAALDSSGRRVAESVMTHLDRARLSPVQGCVYTCQFCDLAGKRYTKHPIEQLMEALTIARQDHNLPVRHVLISGGTTNRSDQAYFDAVCCHVARESGLPVDVMMTPRAETGFVDRMLDAGLRGFSLNVEVYDAELAQVIVPQKARLGRSVFEQAIRHAVEATGGGGRVRSLIVVGLESTASTLEAVEFLARLGCDPVLSPFRPARGTTLAERPPVSARFLSEVYSRSLEIARDYGVCLGPRCIPDQHNTLTLPDGSSRYYYS